MKYGCLNCDNENYDSSTKWYSPDFCCERCYDQYLKKREQVAAKGIKWSPYARERFV